MVKVAPRSLLNQPRAPIYPLLPGKLLYYTYLPPFLPPSFSFYKTSLSLLFHLPKISASFVCSNIPEDVSSAVSHRSSGRERPISAVGEASGLHQRPLLRRCRLVSGANIFDSFLFVSFVLVGFADLIWSGVRGLEIQGRFVKFTAIGVYLESSAVPALAVEWKGKPVEELADSVDFFRDVVTGNGKKYVFINFTGFWRDFP